MIKRVAARLCVRARLRLWDRARVRCTARFRDEVWLTSSASAFAAAASIARCDSARRETSACAYDQFNP